MSPSRIRHNSPRTHSSNVPKVIRRRLVRRTGAVLTAFVVVGVLAIGFIVVSGSAAGEGFRLPASVIGIFASRTATPASPEINAPVAKPLAPTAVMLSWNTNGNAGTETTEPSTSNDPNLSAANLTLGSVTAAANGNRFGGSAWFDAGDTNPTTLTESIAGNDYIQFIVTPNAGVTFTPTSLVFRWDRSATGPGNVTLRSSADSFATDLGTVTGIVVGAFASNTITISGLTNLSTATTFRLYGYGATAAGGTGGFDTNVAGDNVVLNGTTAVATSSKYRSRQIGNWNDFNTWQIDTGGGFVDATAGQTPTSADDTIQIQNTHTVTVTASVSADQLTVDAGGAIQVNPSQTLTIANGAGTDLTNNGTVAVSGTGTITNSGQVTINNLLRLNGNPGGTVTGNSCFYGAGATLEYSASGVSQTTTDVEFPNVSGPTNLTINNSSGVTLHAGRGISGTLDLINGIFTTNTNLFMQNGSQITKSAGDMTGTPAGPGTYNVIYTGFAKMSGSELDGIGLTNVTVDMNPSQFVTLTGNKTVPGTLFLTNGMVITSSFTLSANGAVTRVNGMVVGNLRRFIPAPGSFTFDVGTISNSYSPVVLNVTAGSFSAAFVVSATGSAMPGISGANKLNRYWTLQNIGNSVTSANLTFTYPSSDVNGTAANYKFVRKEPSGVLAVLAPTGTPTTTTATINGVTQFSDWTLAEANAVQSGSLQFSSATYSDNETNTDHTFNAVVTRTGGSDGLAAVNFAVTDGTALVSGNDYIATPDIGFVQWSAGDSSSKNITITVKGDLSNEGDETVNFAITAPMGGAGAALGSPNTAVLTIVNDDAPPGETHVTLAGGNLIITDVNGGTSNDTLAISLSGANVRVNDPSRVLSAGFGTVQVDANTVDAPLASITGNIQVDTLGGADDVTLSFVTGNFLPAGGLTYAGGAGTSSPGDRLAIVGGSQGTVTYNYTNANDGNVVMSALGTVTYTGLEPIFNNGSAVDVIFNLPAGTSHVAMLSDLGGGSSRLESTGTFEQTDFANPSGSVTVTAGSLNDFIGVSTLATNYPSLTINGGQGTDVVSFSGDITFAVNKNLDVNLQNDDPTPGIDDVAVDGELIASGTGTVDVRASEDVIINSNGRLQTQNGNLTVEANQQTPSTATEHDGVVVDGGTIESTGSGNVLVKGRGGEGAFDVMYGVIVWNAGKILSTGTGTITVEGTGGARTGGPILANSEVFGVYVYLLGSEISSASGAIQITGQGGATNDTSSYGVIVAGGKIQTSGAGTLTINGTGGIVTGGHPTPVDSAGFFVVQDDAITPAAGVVASTGTGANAGNIVITGTSGPAGAGAGQGLRVDAPGSVTTVDGSITLNGTGGACGNACLGTSIRGLVEATGTGAINITGTGAASTGAFPTHGVNVRTGGTVTTASGNITITGTGGNGIDNAGFNVGSSGPGLVQTTGGGTITVSADTIRLVPNPNATIDAGASTVSLQQKTNGFAINLGSAIDNTASTVELSDGELDRVTAGTLNLGNASSGAVTVSANISRAAATILNLTSGANVDIATGSLNSNGGNVTLVPGTNVFPSNSGVDVTTSAATTLSLTSAKDLKIVINNTTVDSGYTQLNVAGLVNLNGANLALSGTHTPVIGQQFTIVNNDSTDPISGTFNGLPEGTSISGFLGSGLNATISYVGATGNDAVLTVVAGPAPEIVVEEPVGNDLTDGDPSGVNFGSQNVGFAGTPKTFTIRNTGTANLTVGTTITPDGANPSDFNVNTTGMSPIVAPGGNTAFTVTFTPSGSGARSAAIHITNDDGGENPFDITLTGTGTCPASFTVDNNGDLGDNAPGDGICNTGTGVCTLRAAIQEANANSISCGPIDIGFSLPSSIITVASELQLNHNININGPTTASIVVAGIAASPTRIFNTMPGRTVSLSYLTVTGGRAAGFGGGMLAQGPSSSTTLTGMLFADNTAVDVNGVAGGGGAATINGGTLTIINSTFSANTGTNGGGILILGGGPLDLINATVTNNNADGNTGAGPCSVDGDGGGIGGPTMPASGISLRNTIVAGNQDCNSNNPNITLAGSFNNLGNNMTSGNPLLNPLANNGGPTFTHSPQSLSAAIDGGNNCVFDNTCVPAVGVALTTDQRGPGFSRKVNGNPNPDIVVEIGAYERQTPTAAGGTIAGRIVDSSGNAVEGAAVRMAGTQNRLAVTDAEGNYHFDEVETAGFYTVTPSRLNFTFSPTERSFSQLGQTTDAIFTASAADVGANPLDANEYFVRQQYLDFLGREPDEAGLTFWVNNIESCGADSNCLAAKRDDTSAAFFLSIESHETGFLVHRMYQAAYGDRPGSPVPILLAEFRPDTQSIGRGVVVNEIGWQAKLEANKQAFALEFVSRARFALAYPAAMTPASFVDKLFRTAGVTPEDVERTTAINEFRGSADTANVAARARVLRRVAENETLQRLEFNQAFVLMQYLGYLGRDPNAGPDTDFSGYNFWLNKLDSFDGDFRRAEMVRSFVVAGEYRARFPR